MIKSGSDRGGGSLVRFDLQTLAEDEPVELPRDEEFIPLGLDFDRRESSHDLTNGLFKQERSSSQQVRFNNDIGPLPTLRRTSSGRMTPSSNLSENEDEPSYHEEMDFAHLDLDFGLQSKSSTTKLWRFVVGLTAFLDFYATLLSYQNYLPENKQLPARLNHWILSNAEALALLFSAVWFVDSFVLAHRQMTRVRHRIDRQRLLLREAEIRDKLFRSRVVYAISLIAQLLLLPTGFYLWIFHLSSNDTTGELQHDSLAVGVIKSTVQYYYTCMSVFIDTEWRAALRRYFWRGVWRPFKMRREIRTFLRMVRWARYLAPLGGTFGLLLRHLSELATIHRQKRLAFLARTQRKAFRTRLARKELEQYCATKIQASYRRRKARKFRYAIALIRGDKAKLQLYAQQQKMRKSFSQGLAIAADKHERLKVLEQKAKSLGRKKKELSQNELRDLYQLRQELQQEASNLLNKKLLLRPDSWFIVLWQNFFVVAVLIEITGLAIIPFLEQRRKSGAEPLSMAVLLKQALLPRSVNNACKLPENGRVSIWRRLLRRFEPKPTCTIDNPWVSWYRNRVYGVVLERFYVTAVVFLVDQAMAIISFMLFLDVFVFFFTGDIQTNTGLLVPRPLFQRYFIPGIFMELAINPYMESTSKLIMSLGSEVIRKDPVRVLRWTVALFYPVSTVLAPFERRFWCYFTHNCNIHIDANTTGQLVEGKRSSSFANALSKVYDTAYKNPIFGSPSTGNLLWI